MEMAGYLSFNLDGETPFILFAFHWIKWFKNIIYQIGKCRWVFESREFFRRFLYWLLDVRGATQNRVFGQKRAWHLWDVKQNSASNSEPCHYWVLSLVFPHKTRNLISVYGRSVLVEGTDLEWDVAHCVVQLTDGSINKWQHLQCLHDIIVAMVALVFVLWCMDAFDRRPATRPHCCRQRIWDW